MQMSWFQRSGLASVALGGALLASCSDGPFLSDTPPALYALAKEQIANANYSRAVDSLARAVREAPQSESAQRARVLRVALLGGMARGFRDMGESYLEGHRRAGEAEHAPKLRSVAMDYFVRTRGRSLEMVGVLDAMQRDPAAHALRMEFKPVEEVGGESPLLEEIRQGKQVSDRERLAAERERIDRGLAEMLVRLAGSERNPNRLWFQLAKGEVEVDLAAFYLGAAREQVEMATIYRSEALGERRMNRFYYERAAALAKRASQLAEEKGDTEMQEDADRLLRHCQELLG